MNSGLAAEELQKRTCTVLFVEDDSFDQDLIRRAVQRIATGVKVQFASTGSEAIAYLRGADRFADRTRYEYPSFVSTDLRMPQGDGFAVLEFMKGTLELANVPMVVLSSSQDLDDIKQAYKLGASAYLVKPMVFDELLRLLGLLLELWTSSEAPPADESGQWLQTEAWGKMSERLRGGNC